MYILHHFFLFAAFLHMEADVMESSGSTSYESESITEPSEESHASSHTISTRSESITVPSEEDPESSDNDELLDEQPPRGYTPPAQRQQGHARTLLDYTAPGLHESQTTYKCKLSSVLTEAYQPLRVSAIVPDYKYAVPNTLAFGRG